MNFYEVTTRKTSEDNMTVLSVLKLRDIKVLRILEVWLHLLFTLTQGNSAVNISFRLLFGGRAPGISQIEGRVAKGYLHVHGPKTNEQYYHREIRNRLC
jgi:hypothetical protein